MVGMRCLHGVVLLSLASCVAPSEEASPQQAKATEQELAESGQSTVADGVYRVSLCGYGAGPFLPRAGA